MAHPFLKSIRPVNLLSFGPKTEEIELRPLNILIGPNGSGKSNLIEVIRLLKDLPSRDSWVGVRESGGVDEWLWKGPIQPSTGSPVASVEVTFEPADPGPLGYYAIRLQKNSSTFTFHVRCEKYGRLDRENPGSEVAYVNRAEHSPDSAYIRSKVSDYAISSAKQLDVRLSILSQRVDVFHYPELHYLERKLTGFAIYSEWTFGSKADVRKTQRAGLESNRLASDSLNLAQLLKAWRDRGDSAVFDRLVELMKKFYAPIKDVDTELIGDYLRVMIKEEGLSSRTPAERLSDGTLRWLMLLVVLLDPAPPPVICIDEPELGLHPDMLPTLADLLVDASTRTQLIVTTHSRSFLDSFTDMPEAVCVCEKIEGSTVIQRLDKDNLKVWLDEYALGKLWTAGQIGGNRW